MVCGTAERLCGRNDLGLSFVFVFVFVVVVVCVCVGGNICIYEFSLRDYTMVRSLDFMPL